MEVSQLDENDEESAESVLAKIDAMVISQNEIEEQEKEKRDAITKLDLEMERYREIINNLAKQKMDLENERRKLRSGRLSLEGELYKLRDRYKNKREKVESEQQLALLESEMDELAKQFKWFECIRTYQYFAAKQFALEKRGILADGMGLGKTITLLAWLDLVQSKRGVIVCPNSLLQNFLNEFAKFAPHRHVIPLGFAKTKEQKMLTLDAIASTMPEFTILINYEAFARDPNLRKRVIELKLDSLVCDEAHRMGNEKSLTFRGIREITYTPNIGVNCESCGTENEYGNKRCDRCGEWISVSFGDRHSIKNVLLTTGTPIVNKPQEAFPLLHLLKPTIFNRMNDFLNHYCTQIYTHSYFSGNRVARWVFQEGKDKRLVARLGRAYLQRTKKEVGLELPPQTEIIHELRFDGEKYTGQQQALEEVKNFFISLANKEDGEILLQNAMVQITRARQLTSWPPGILIKHPVTGKISRQIDIPESIKLDEAMEIITQAIDGGERVVVFSKNTAPLEELHRRLQEAEIRSVTFHGATKQDVRIEVVKDFDASITPHGQHKWDVILANYKTGGVGLNLTGASTVVAIDEEWSPKTRDQAYARVDRSGQVRETSVHVLRVMDTIDEWVGELLRHKEYMIGDFDETAVAGGLMRYLKEKFKNEQVLGRK